MMKGSIQLSVHLLVIHLWFKKSLTKNLENMNKKCTIFKTYKVQSYFSLNDKTPLNLQANVVYLFEDSCGKIQTYIGNTKTFGI